MELRNAQVLLMFCTLFMVLLFYEEPFITSGVMLPSGQKLTFGPTGHHHP
jgi:hypothetical protein